MLEEDKKKLKEEVVELKKKLFSLRIKKSSGDLKDTSILKKTRKAVAKLFTKLNRQD